MTTETCDTCGVPITDDPEAEGLHPVQELTESDRSVLCLACVDEEETYQNTGADIVKASQVNLDAEELAVKLAENVYAEEIRAWMSAHGLSRRRGSRKLDSAQQAVEQDPVLVACTLVDMGAIEIGTMEYKAMCSCGYEETFTSAEAAETAAAAHKSENPQHFPKAWDDRGVRLYG